MRSVIASRLRQSIGFVALFMLLISSSGCSTLSSLGLPFGSSSNNLLQATKNITENSSKSFLVPKELGKQNLEAYIIEAGDTLFIEPVSFDATIRLAGDQVVKPDGTIAVGEFGRYVATNKTVGQIQTEIQEIINLGLRDSLERSFYLEEQERQAEELRRTNRWLQKGDTEADQPEEKTAEEKFEESEERRRALERRIAERVKQNQVTVRLVNWDSKRFYVLGEVNSPGSFNYIGNETVLDALVQAGGLTSKANFHEVIITRPTTCNSCRVVMKVCYQQIVQLGDASTNYQLQPGDRVFVPGLSFREDLKQSLLWFKEDKCPRCSCDQVGCDLPAGCE